MDKPKCFGSYDSATLKSPCRRCNFWEACKFTPPEKPKRQRKAKVKEAEEIDLGIIS